MSELFLLPSLKGCILKKEKRVWSWGANPFFLMKTSFSEGAQNLEYEEEVTKNCLLLKKRQKNYQVFLFSLKFFIWYTYSGWCLPNLVWTLSCFDKHLKKTSYWTWWSVASVFCCELDDKLVSKQAVLYWISEHVCGN